MQDCPQGGGALLTAQHGSIQVLGPLGPVGSLTSDATAIAREMRAMPVPDGSNASLTGHNRPGDLACGHCVRSVCGSQHLMRQTMIAATRAHSKQDQTGLESLSLPRLRSDEAGGRTAHARTGELRREAVAAQPRSGSCMARPRWLPHRARSGPICHPVRGDP